MRILLTGGTGFIGRNLLEGLQGDFKIFSPSHEDLEIMDYSAVRKFILKNRINIVIHTAVKDGADVLENILRMYLSICNNLDLLDKFINFGSGAEYAKTRDLIKVKETELGKHIPEDNYGLGKLICSKLASDNKKIITLLPFGIYGSYEDYRFKFISNAIVKNLIGLPLKIKQDVIFDYLYVADLVPIVKFFLKNRKAYGDFNVTTTKSISLTDIVKIINQVSKKPSKVTVTNGKLNYQYTGSNDKLRKIFPALSLTPYKDSIEKLFAYYSENIRQLNKEDIGKDVYYTKAKIR